ncbi:hypothetical protein EDB59_0850 [Vibrio crassostreae]|uniref:hypothetical protein n=1 Tax=Vibrio crassostreae TaxID=246167 RepID=UPI000F4602B3|nr:hypothetical protein [Vibrio crassostreae]ROR70202.1 hypothetical protein EDB59_0850 [Vibrio crassostreae]
MYKEIALDPHCMSEYHYYALLKSAFGFENGRYLVAPTKEWVREAYQSVKASDIAPTKKKSVTNFLNKLQRDKANPFIVLPKDRADSTLQSGYENWLNWMTSQHSLRAFNAVVSEQAGTEHINYEQIIDGDTSWSIPPTLWIDKTEHNILDVTVPLLNVGQELIIADPYFKLPGNALLKAILRRAIGAGVRSVSIVTTMDCSNLSGVFEREYQASMVDLPLVNYIRVPHGFIHDRYLLSDKAAIKAGQGFSTAPEKGLQSDRLSISLCGLKEYRETKACIDEYKNKHPEMCTRLGE